MKFLEKYGFYIGLLTDIISILIWIKLEKITISIIVLFISIIPFIFATNYLYKKYKSSKMDLHGLNLDILNLSTISQQMNNNLFLYSIEKTFYIKEKELKIVSNYKGKVKNNNADGLLVNLGASTFSEYKKVDFFAYDLHNDPQRRTKIDLELKSPIGIAKTFFIPFLKKPKKHELYNLECNYQWSDCMKLGIDYCFSKLPFKKTLRNRKLNKFKINLIFIDFKPEWVKCYSVKNDIIYYLYYLTEPQINRNTYIYTDNPDNVDVNSIRIYIFKR